MKMRTFHFILFSIVCQLIVAQTIKTDKPLHMYHYRLVTSEGRGLTNCVFSEAKVDESGYCAMVTWKGHNLLLDNEARLIVPHTINDENIIKGGFYHDKTGNEATNNIYDCHGNVLEENVKSLTCNATLTTRDGRTIHYYMLKNTDDDKFLCGPNLARLRKVESCFTYSEILLINDGQNQYVTDLAGNVLIDKCEKIEIYNFDQFLYTYSKPLSKYGNLYNWDDLKRLKFVFAYTSTMVSLYTVDGKLLYSERLPKDKYKYYKQRRNIVTKKIAKLYANKNNFENAYYNLVDRAEEFFNNHQPHAKSQQMMSFSKYMSTHSPLHIFPVAQYNDSLKESPSLSKKLKQNKFGKIKNYRRCVEEDGFIFYKIEYTQGAQGVLDSNGDVLVPPTKYNTVYHSTDQTLVSYEINNDIHYTHQIYNWNGKLLLDCDKKKIEHASLSILDDNRCYFTVRKNGKQGVLDYFGVQITPIAYPMDGTLYYSSSSETFIFSENDFNYDTKYSLSKTSHPGGKPSVARKMPSSEVAMKDFLAAKGTDIKAKNNMKYDECWATYNSSTNTYERQRAMEQCLQYCQNNKQRGLVLNNIGVQYDRRGEYSAALPYFEQAASLGDETGKKNLTYIRNRIQQHALQQQQVAQQQQARQDNTTAIMYGIADALNQLGQAFQPSPNNTSQNNNYQYNNSQYNNSQYNSGNTRNHNSTTNTTNQDFIDWRNWRIESRVYDDYDTKLAAMQTLTWPYQNGYNDSDRIKFQKEMKRIREKWQNKAYHITKSSREDWNGR